MASDQDNHVTYDLQPVKAPRLAGKALAVFATLAERPVIGSPLRGQMLTSVRIGKLRAANAGSVSPLLEPLPAGDDVPAASVLPPLELAARSSAVPAPATAGFTCATISDYAAAYRSGSHTPSEIAGKLLEAIAASERMTPPLRAFIAQDQADFMAQANASTARFQRGEPLSILDGVPVAVKDEVDMVPYPTTLGTKFMGKQPAREDATTVARLRAAGALLIGKTNMHELGLGITGLNPHHGAARNPYDPARATGGSSSGVATAVAAGFCPVGLAADGGGSIRIPASFCGLVGLKATFGRVSEHGAGPLCWTVGHLGPIAFTARDAAAAYAIMAGPDSRDPNTRAQPPLHLDRFGDTDLSGITLGIYRPWFEDADAAVVAACRQVVDGLQKAGATIIDVAIPNLDLIRLAHLVIIGVEIATAQQPYYERHRTDYGLDNRLNLVLAQELTGIDYVQALRLRTRLSQECAVAMARVHGIITPSIACTAPLLPADALTTGESDMDLLSRVMRFMPLANLTGLPAISFPAGYDAAGLPIGCQIIGQPWQEHLLLRLAHTAEQFVARRPPRCHYPLLAPVAAVR